MHQIIVVLIALALIEAHYAVWIPAAVAHKTAQEVVTTGNAVDRSRLWRGKHGLNGLLEFRGDTLVGVDHQHVITGSILLRALALDAIALPVRIDKDLCTRCAGNVHRVVRAAGVKDDDFVSPGDRSQAVRKQVGGVFGDHHDRQTR